MQGGVDDLVSAIWFSSCVQAEESGFRADLLGVFVGLSSTSVT